MSITGPLVLGAIALISRASSRSTRSTSDMLCSAVPSLRPSASCRCRWS